MQALFLVRASSNLSEDEAELSTSDHGPASCMSWQREQTLRN